jgi:hypothetical protein
MKSDLVDIALIRDLEIVAAICADIRSGGRLLICHGCADIEALIMGFVVLDNGDQAFALCGACMGKLPVHGAIT